jgi:hypothetical protein
MTDPTCDVAVALPVPGLYSYAVPAALAARVVVGARVLVPFGGRGVAGVVVRWPATAPADVTPRALADVLGAPIAPELVGLALWIAEYYEAPPGEALRLVQPTGTGESSTRVVAITDAGRAALDGEGSALSPSQARLLARLGASPRPLARTELARAADAVAALLERGLAEEHDARQRPRTRVAHDKVVALIADPAAARAATSRAPAQRAVIDALVDGPRPLATLVETLPGAAAAVRALAKAERVVVRDVPRALTAVAQGDALPAAVTPPVLTDEQRRAVAAIGEPTGFAAILLHGVTGAGKTEVYLHAIGHARAAGRGAIVLVPEISLTPQLASRFPRSVWTRGRDPALRVVGARSAVGVDAPRARRRSDRGRRAIGGVRAGPRPGRDRGRRGARRIVQAGRGRALPRPRCRAGARPARWRGVRARLGHAEPRVLRGGGGRTLPPGRAGHAADRRHLALRRGHRSAPLPGRSGGDGVGAAPRGVDRDPGRRRPGDRVLEPARLRDVHPVSRLWPRLPLPGVRGVVDLPPSLGSSALSLLRSQRAGPGAVREVRR